MGNTLQALGALGQQQGNEPKVKISTSIPLSMVAAGRVGPPGPGAPGAVDPERLAASPDAVAMLRAAALSRLRGGATPGGMVSTPDRPPGPVPGWR